MVQITSDMQGFFNDLGYTSTYFKILKSNEREKILQDNIIRYNASIGKAKAYERANFAIISGQVAKQQSRLSSNTNCISSRSNLINHEHSNMN
jgi:hypothetical protein